MQGQLFKNKESLEKYNITGLLDYLQCPKNFEINNIKNDKKYFTNSVKRIDECRFGVFLHKIAADYLSLGVTRQLELLENNFKQRFGGLNFVDRYGWYEEYFNKLAILHDLFKNTKDILVESKHRICVGGCLIGGGIDCVVDGLTGKESIYLIDFKMTNEGFYDPKYFKHKYLQLIFYRWLIEDKFQRLVDMDRLKGAYYYFDTGELDEIEFTKEVVEDGKRTIENLVKEVSRAKEFPPRKCHICLVCGYREKCEVGSK